MKVVEDAMNEITSKFVESPLQTGAASLAAASLGYLFIKGIKGFVFKDSKVHAYPPGPPRLPLLGAATSFPKDHLYRAFKEWANVYGDIVYAPVLGINMVILNTHDTAHELLSKRPNSTSRRHISYLVETLMTIDWSIPVLQPGAPLANQRKMLRRGIGPQRIGSYDHLVESSVAKLMAELETFQGNPKFTFLHAMGRMVIEFTYGEQIWHELGDKLIPWNIKNMELINEAFFGFWLVDFFHFLRFVPDWVPGLRYKQVAREGSDVNPKVRHRAYTRALELYKSGTLGHCILNDLLEEFGEDEDVRDATSVLYGVAADTTTGAITSYLLALFLYPDVAQRIYEEVQTVTHGERLPNIADRPNLPYTEAVFKESVRFRPFLPLGIPHVNSEDEVIRGYFIPKGTMIHQCAYAMLHDPRVWEEPEVFKPERFLDPSAAEKPNPLTVLFGYGMRICPGMYLADRVSFHMVATIASLFKVLPLEGKTVPEPTSLEYEDTAVQQPIGFECRFVARDEKARDLLKTVALHE
ncbi:cytochrome P450 [Serendipita vermifera]|nr:cytochrome P450 [Serendipita vermifera]